MIRVISTEMIKPSSATPPHLKTYNLSVYDQFIPSTFNPLVIFYSNSGIYHNSHDQMLDLKNSLSRILTKYYPFAGRHARIAPTYVDCNDLGAEFIEASVDGSLSDFLKNSKHEDLDQLFPYGRTWNNSKGSGHDLQNDSVIALAIKVNHFTCKGLAVAVSLSHKIADVNSLIMFLHDWAKMTRVCSRNERYEVGPIEPHFLSFKHMNLNFSGFSLEVSNDCVTRSFVFPNAKIHELKLEVSAMCVGFGHHITNPNPTRVEVVTWLLYKCAIKAATKYNMGSFKPTCICLPVNLRNKMINSLHGNCIGNYLMRLEVHTRNQTEMKPEVLISELRNQKMKIHGIKDIEDVFASLLIKSLDFNIEERQRKFENAYISSSLCGSSTYEIDFGWGTPIRVTAPGNLKKNSFVLLDAPNGEGIEVLVCLGKQDMAIIQSDIELLRFANVSSSANSKAKL